MKDYYSLLGIEQSATKAEIKKNYRLLATKFHPDKNSDPDAAAKFIAITEAYEVLSNKKTRTQYDLFKWEQLKRKTTSDDDYSIVVPPRESTRTRRNKLQQKRSIKYNQTNNETNQLLQLVIEGFHIASRYIPHLVGATILGVILYSAINNLSEGIEQSFIRGLVVSAFILGIIYCIFWLGRNVFIEFKKDLEAFSVFYKISKQKVTVISLLVFAFVLVLYLGVLKAF